MVDSGKADTLQKRKCECAVKPTTGRRTTHEYVFVKIFGSHWHHNISTLKWKDFQTQALSLSLLSLSPPSSLVPASSPPHFPSPSLSSPKLSLLGPLSLSALPLPKACDSDSRWDWDPPDKTQFQFVVDCQPLAKFICGQAKYEGDDLVLFNDMVDISNVLVNFLSVQNCIPRKTIDPPVLWRRRTWNILADGLCDRAIKTKTSECFFSPSILRIIYTCKENPVHFQGHSDGSSCASIGVCAAACTLCAWIFDSEHHRWGRHLVALRTSFFDTPLNSLRTEAMGLKMAFELLEAVLAPDQDWPEYWHALASD